VRRFAPSFSRTIEQLAKTVEAGEAKPARMSLSERRGALPQALSPVAVEGPESVLSLVARLVQSHPDAIG
jgi:hypothetical protein